MLPITTPENTFDHVPQHSEEQERSWSLQIGEVYQNAISQFASSYSSIIPERGTYYYCTGQYKAAAEGYSKTANDAKIKQKWEEAALSFSYAASSYESAKKEGQEPKDSTNDASCYQEAARCYLKSGNVEKAVNLFIRAAEIFFKNESFVHGSSCLEEGAEAFAPEIHLFPGSDKKKECRITNISREIFFLEAIQQLKDLPETARRLELSAYFYENLDKVLKNAIHTSIELEYSEKARENFETAGELYLELNNEDNKIKAASCFSNAARLCHNDMEKKNDLYTKAAQLQEDSGALEEAIDTYAELERSYYGIKEYKKAAELCLKQIGLQENLYNKNLYIIEECYVKAASYLMEIDDNGEAKELAFTSLKKVLELVEKDEKNQYLDKEICDNREDAAKRLNKLGYPCLAGDILKHLAEVNKRSLKEEYHRKAGKYYREGENYSEAGEQFKKSAIETKNLSRDSSQNEWSCDPSELIRRWEDAKEMFLKLLGKKTSVSLRSKIGQCYENIADTELSLNNFCKATENYDLAANFYEETKKLSEKVKECRESAKDCLKKLLYEKYEELKQELEKENKQAVQALFIDILERFDKLKEETTESQIDSIVRCLPFFINEEPFSLELITRLEKAINSYKSHQPTDTKLEWIADNVSEIVPPKLVGELYFYAAKKYSKRNAFNRELNKTFSCYTKSAKFFNKAEVFGSAADAYVKAAKVNLTQSPNSSKRVLNLLLQAEKCYLSANEFVEAAKALISAERYMVLEPVKKALRYYQTAVRTEELCPKTSAHCFKLAADQYLVSKKYGEALHLYNNAISLYSRLEEKDGIYFKCEESAELCEKELL